MKPELIIFDLGRVLVDFDFEKVIRNLKRHSPLTKKQIHTFFIETPLWDSFERGKIEPNEFFLQISKELQLTNLSFKEFGPIWNSIFTKKHDSIKILDRLRSRYRIALLSNINIMHWDYIVESHDFMSWFDHPIASYAVGQRKPDVDIFRTTLQIAKVKPSKAIFIDDLEPHVLAARSLGIRAHQFINAPQLARDLKDIL